MGGPRRCHRRHRRPRSSRLLRGAEGDHVPLPPPLGCIRPSRDRGRRGGPRILGLHSPLGAPPRRRPGRPVVGAPRLPPGARGRRPWHRCRHPRRAREPARHPDAHGARQARRVGSHHWLGWLRGARRPDRADQRGLRIAAGPDAEPLSSRRPHRRLGGHRVGDRRHLQGAARRGGARRGDRLPRRHRGRGAAPRHHRLGHLVLGLRRHSRATHRSSATCTPRD